MVRVVRMVRTIRDWISKIIGEKFETKVRTSTLARAEVAGNTLQPVFFPEALWGCALQP